MKSQCLRVGIWKPVGCALVGISVFAGVHSNAVAQVNAAQLPLFISSSVDPNIMFVLDDSGSMHWETTPDDVLIAEYVFPRAAGNYGGADYANNSLSFRDASPASATERGQVAALRSFHINKSYYNPAVTYRPWSKPAGMAFPSAVPAVDTAADSFPNAPPTAAPNHPIRNTGTRNLTVDNTQTATWRPGGANESRTFYPAVYYQYLTGPNFDRSSYEKVEIRATTPLYSGHGRENRSDCAAGVCTYAQEIQNFANWYTYYRSRMLSAQAGIGRAFNTQPENMRIGFGAINKAAETIDGVSTRTVIRGVRPFLGADRTAFFRALYEGVWMPSNTPLRRALDDVGQYFSRTDNRGPWGAVPGVDDPSEHLSCRQNYTILMTDGYWTNNVASEASTGAVRANVDGSPGPTITDDSTPPRSFTYTPASPFEDNQPNTLADIAMYYWNRDLRSTLANNVPTSDANPAFWQHMVTYGVGFGVAGTINPSVALGALTASPPPTITWPNPIPSNPAKIDDLLHAAVNGRGGFFSAADPDTFAEELGTLLTSILARVTAAGTSAAASSAVLQSSTLLYTATYRSDDWSGTIIARRLDEDGAPDPTLAGVAWDAENILAARDPDDRDIFTSTETGTGIPFELASLSLAQRAALDVNPTGAPATSANAGDRVDWLKGTDFSTLRSRLIDGEMRRIGDLVGSDPQFMSKRDFGYSNLPGAAPERSSYNAFRNSSPYSTRPDTLFVGSNGGMFHAFDAINGTELFAYIPSELLLPGTSGAHAQINELMRPDYTHRFYVDGAAEVADVYTSGAWRTAVVGTMGAGGRTVFALDVTDPASFNQSRVMWEFKHSSSPCVADPTGVAGSRACRDIGYGITKPKVVRLANGRWAAVFGNGYNSYDHRARLMVVDMQTGRLLYSLLTPDNVTSGGSASASNPNGLSPVETTDWPVNNLQLANAYAGDLLGNLWRFDFRTTTPTITRIYSAVDGATPATRQPITAAPLLALKPGDVSDIVVLFGTGSFFRVGDDNLTAPQIQTFYGIFDEVTPSSTPALRSELLSQTITQNSTPVTIGSITYPRDTLRYLTQNTLSSGQRGWRVDLPALGERVVSQAVFPSGAVQERVRFATLIPDDDPCSVGRQGFLMDMSILSGGRMNSPAFDLNGDGIIDSNDNGGGDVPSGMSGPKGETPTIIRDPSRDADNIYNGEGERTTKGSNTAGPTGRQSWRQLR